MFNFLPILIIEVNMKSSVEVCGIDIKSWIKCERK